MHPLLDRLAAAAAANPIRRAACDQSLILDYRSLCAVARGLAGQIASLSQQPRVGVLAPTSSVGAAAIIACWYAGRVPVPLNFLLTPAELARVVADAGLDLIVTIEHFLPAVAPLGLRTLTLSGQTLVPGSGDAPAANGSDTAVVIYTSGTAGDPKGVCLSFDNLIRNADACIEHAKIDPDSVFVSVLPQFHSFGFTAMTVVPLVLGGTVWFLPRFSPLAVADTIAEKRATVFMAVASMYAALAQLKRPHDGAFASLKLAISGGEPLPRRVAQAFAERFGVELLEGYGLTETSPVVSLNTPEANRPGSVGRPLPGVEVLAADAAGGALPPGEEGELLVRGHCLMQGYLNQPEATRAALRDGWLWTGDVGRVDADGFVHITGRAKEMIIIGGENVFPREIEQVLLDHPAVADAAVIGRPDALRGEAPVAYAILREGMSATPSELREFCRSRLAGYKVPREVRLATELPRGPTGKILKRALPEWQ